MKRKIVINILFLTIFSLSFSSEKVIKSKSNLKGTTKSSINVSTKASIEKEKEIKKMDISLDIKTILDNADERKYYIKLLEDNIKEKNQLMTEKAISREEASENLKTIKEKDISNEYKGFIQEMNMYLEKSRKDDMNHDAKFNQEEIDIRKSIDRTVIDNIKSETILYLNELKNKGIELKLVPSTMPSYSINDIIIKRINDKFKTVKR